MRQALLSDGHITAALAKSEAGIEPWASAIRQLIEAADKALTQEPLSVRDNGGSPHLRVDAVYIPGQDGVHNDEANMKGRIDAGRISHACIDLALAWRFTGDSRYADKALQLIHHWCINQNTKMFPTGRIEDPWTTGAQYGGDVVLFLAFEGMYRAGHLLDGYTGWDIRAHAAVRRWVRSMIEVQRPVMFFNGAEMYNNWDDARLSYLCAGALMLDDLDLLIEVFERWAHILPMKMTDEGELPRETMRTRSMNYTLMALWHSMEVAAVARACDVDLLNLNINGKTIRKAVDYVAGYLLEYDKWPHQQITPFMDKGGSARVGLFEIAYREWGDEKYLQILNQYGGRPTPGSPATLLYADPTGA